MLTAIRKNDVVKERIERNHYSLSFSLVIKLVIVLSISKYIAYKTNFYMPAPKMIATRMSGITIITPLITTAATANPFPLLS